MKWCIPVILLSLTGCADLIKATQSDGGEGLGTHNYTITKDGDIKVNVHSIYGGPAFKVETDADGVQTITVTPANRIQIEKLIDVLGVP